jgi:hypothetical protein
MDMGNYAGMACTFTPGSSSGGYTGGGYWVRLNRPPIQVVLCTFPFNCSDEPTGSSEGGGQSKTDLLASDGGAGAKGPPSPGEAAASIPEDQPVTKVGRWMSDEEYQKMIETGKVQPGGGGITYAAQTPEGYMKQAATGSLYVTFDVPSSSFTETNKELGWLRFLSPDSPEGRLAAIKGLPIPQLPDALNIEVLAIRI